MDGIEFDSIAEMKHYANLKLLQQRGLISQLQYEPEFKFIVNDVQVGTYKPDFTFVGGDKKLHVQDVKGWKRSVKTGKMLPRVDKGFRIRKNLMKACFGLEVEVV